MFVNLAMRNIIGMLNGTVLVMDFLLLPPLLMFLDKKKINTDIQ